MFIDKDPRASAFYKRMTDTVIATLGDDVSVELDDLGEGTWVAIRPVHTAGAEVKLFLPQLVGKRICINHDSFAPLLQRERSHDLLRKS